MSDQHEIPTHCRRTHFYGARRFDLVRASNGVIHSVIVHATRPSSHRRVLRLIDGEDENGLELHRIVLPPSSLDEHDAHALDEFEARHPQTIHNTNFDRGLFVVSEDPSDDEERARLATERAPLLAQREALRQALKATKDRKLVIAELVEIKRALGALREIHPKDREDNGLEVTIVYSSPRPKPPAPGVPL